MGNYGYMDIISNYMLFELSAKSCDITESQ